MAQYSSPPIFLSKNSLVEFSKFSKVIVYMTNLSQDSVIFVISIQQSACTDQFLPFPQIPYQIFCKRY